MDQSTLDLMFVMFLLGVIVGATWAWLMLELRQPKPYRRRQGRTNLRRWD